VTDRAERFCELFGDAPGESGAALQSPHGTKAGNTLLPNLGVTPRLYFLVLVPWIVPCAGAAAADAGRVKNVLVLYTHAKDLPAGIIISESIHATFDASSDQRIEVFEEYLDLGRFGDEHYEARLAEHYRQKYARLRIDLIITVVAPALDFARKYGDRIFPGVPIVYCAIYKKELETRTIGPRVTGMAAEVDMNATLDLALQLHPGTRRVVVLAGASDLDAYWIALARQAFRRDEENGRAEFVYLTGPPMREVQDAVAHLPEKTIVFYLQFLRDGDGGFFRPREALELISRASNAPMYGLFDSYLGHGIVGGRLLSFEAEGRIAAKRALRTLAGKDVVDGTSAAEKTNTYMFDARQLRRWGVSEDRLPAGSVIRYREPTIWEQYKWRLLGGIILCLLEALFISRLLVQRARQKRLERSLDDRLRFEMLVTELSRTLVHSTANETDQAIIHGLERVVGFLGARRGSLFEFSEASKSFKKTHSYHVDATGAAPDFIGEDQFPWIVSQLLFTKDVRLTGLEDLPADAAIDRRNCQRFGTQSLLMIPLSTGTGTFGALALASGDIGRNWADEFIARLRLLGEVFTSALFRQKSDEILRGSQQQLRILARQLLQAQEMERRRLAREMHDDLTQRLAVLAIQAGQLEQRLALAGPDLERLTGIRDSLVRLSEDVHSLSRQLHPSILDDLGLVDALRSECATFQEREGIDVDYRAEDVPADLPKDIALCVYRVTQEALRNIAKHAGTKQGQVAIVGNGTDLLLTVSDHGQGFDPNARRSGPGLGLASMDERAILIGAELSIHSKPGQGTTISMLVSPEKETP
jgi:signal transduction histidine kinase